MWRYGADVFFFGMSTNRFFFIFEEPELKVCILGAVEFGTRRFCQSSLSSSKWSLTVPAISAYSLLRALAIATLLSKVYDDSVRSVRKHICICLFVRQFQLANGGVRRRLTFQITCHADASFSIRACSYIGRIHNNESFAGDLYGLNDIYQRTIYRHVKTSEYFCTNFACRGDRLDKYGAKAHIVSAFLAHSLICSITPFP